MSHVEAGPLAGYNSLMDPNLSGYFGNTRMRRHLKKAGLVNRKGEIISENTYRLNMARKEHKKHVRDILAQAIVHKTLDMERTRQVAIRQKIEEIAKIELVKRIRTDRGRKGDEDVLPYLTPRQNGRPSSVPSGGRRGSARPTSGKAHSSRKRSSSQGSDGHIYIDDEGQPIDPPPRDRSESPDVEYERSNSRGRKKEGKDSKYPKGEVDDRHLYALDQRTLREYTMAQAQVERGLGPSPYTMPAYHADMTPSPPQGSPRSTGRRSHRAKKDKSQKGKGNQGSLLLHRQEPAMKHQERVQTLCEVSMHYFGSSLRLDYETFDPRDDVIVEQQHCGGNTLHVFKEKIKPGSDFTFTSRRHRGYPFSLTFYVNGTLDCRLSTCCEYKHQKGSRLGGSKGHFGMLGVKGAAPCYKCQIAEGSKPKKEKKKRTKKRETRAQEEEGEKETVEVPVNDEEERQEGDTQRDVKVKGMKDDNETERDRQAKGDSVQIPVEEDAHEETRREDNDEEAYGDDFEDEDEDGDKHQQQVVSKGKEKSYSDDDFEDAKSGSSRSSSRSSRSRSRSGSSSSSRSGSSRSSSSSSSSSRSRSRSSGDDTGRKQTKKNKSKEAKDQPAPSKEAPEKPEEKQETPIVAAALSAAPERRDSVSSSSSSISSSSSDEEEESAKPGPVKTSPKEPEVKATSPEPDKQENEVREVSVKVADPEPVREPVVVVEETKSAQETTDKSTDENHSAAPLTRAAPDSDSDSSSSDSSVDDSDSSTSRNKEPESVKTTAEPVSAEPPPPAVTDKDIDKEDQKDEPKPANVLAVVKASAPKDNSDSEGSSDNGSPSSSDSSDSDSDTDDKPSKETNTQVKSVEKDKENVPTPQHSDSDQDGGHDPDGVMGDDTPRPFLPSEVGTTPGESLEGSIRPKVEDQHDVDLSGIGLSKDQVAELVNLLRNHEDLEILSLRNCGIDNDDLKDISESLMENSCDLKLLNLSCSKLDEDSVDWVVEIIREKKDLAVLLLNGVPLGDAGMERLVNGMIDIHVHRLGEEATMTQEQLKAIKEAAHGMVANVIGDVLASSSVPSVASTTSDASEGTKQLISKMEENKQAEPEGCSLRQLDLGDCGITDTGMQHIAKLVAANIGITKLELSGNKHISDSGWKVLADAIKTNVQLKTLSLDYSKIWDSHVAILVEAMKENKTLISLDLEGNKITNDGAKKILEMLREHNTTLCDITLVPGNTVDEDVLQQIKKVLQERTRSS